MTDDNPMALAMSSLAALDRVGVRAVLSWWSRFSVSAKPERLSRLITTRHKRPALKTAKRSDAPPAHHAASLAEEESILLAAFSELQSNADDRLQEVCDWWARHAALGPAKLSELISSLDAQPETTKVVKANLVSSGLGIEFAERELDSPAAFSFRLSGHKLTIFLNTGHSGYSVLRALLDSEHQAAAKALLGAWALLEHDAPEGVRRDRIGETRLDWGRTLRRLLNEEGLRTCIET